MGSLVKGLFGGGSSRKARAMQEADAAQSRSQSEGAQLQQLQQMTAQRAETDKSLAAVRKAPRGRRLLMADSGGKATLG